MLDLNIVERPVIVDPENSLLFINGGLPFLKALPKIYRDTGETLSYGRYIPSWYRVVATDHQASLPRQSGSLEGW